MATPPARQLPSEIEAAAYFVACEALTNTVKHAAASHATLRATRQDGRLVVRIEQDGIGGARLEAGSGLAGLAKRVERQGGQLRVRSPAGSGTVVEAAWPCAS